MPAYRFSSRPLQFNHPSFYIGDQNINSVNFGKITSQFYSYDGVGLRVMQFGPLMLWRHIIHYSGAEKL